LKCWLLLVVVEVAEHKLQTVEQVVVEQVD
jgi:hypothetical protein